MTTLIAIALPVAIGAAEVIWGLITASAATGALIYSKSQYDKWKKQKAEEEYVQHLRTSAQTGAQQDVQGNSYTESVQSIIDEHVPASSVDETKFPIRTWSRKGERPVLKQIPEIDVSVVNPVQFKDLTPSWKVRATLNSQEPIAIEPKALNTSIEMASSDLMPVVPPENNDNWWKKFKNRKIKRTAKQQQYPELHINKGLSPTTTSLMKGWTTGAISAVGTKAVDEGLGYFGYEPIFQWENPQYVEFKGDNPIIKAVLENTPFISSVDSAVEHGLSSDETASAVARDGWYVLGNAVSNTLNPVLQARMYKQQPYLIAADIISDSAQNQIDKNANIQKQEIDIIYPSAQQQAIDDFNMSNHTRADSIRLMNAFNGLNGSYDYSDEELEKNEDLFEDLGLPTNVYSVESILNKKQHIENKYDNIGNNIILPALTTVGDIADFWALRNPYTLTRW